MRKEKVIDCINKQKRLSYQKSIEAFFSYYQSCVDGLLQHYSDKQFDTEQSYMVSALQNWLESEGYSLFYDVIEQLNDEVQEKIEGFIELYSFLLSNSESNVLKLVDQLLYIPGQFAREFIRVQMTQVIREKVSLVNDFGRKTESKYIFNTEGAFERGSLFYWRIRYEN